MAQPFKETLKGVGEIFAFMPSSVNRFSDTREDAFKSFAYPFLLYPLGIFLAVINLFLSDVGYRLILLYAGHAPLLS